MPFIRIRETADCWLELVSPIQVWETTSPADVPAMLDAIERAAVSDHCYVVGFLTYEAGAAFGLRTRHAALKGPLAWFAAFRANQVRTARTAVTSAASYALGPLTATLSREAFVDGVERIRRHLAAGDCYQVNYTFRLEGTFSGDPDAFFADLAANQRGAYSMLIRTEPWTICCASPELFFERRGEALTMRPMKGTARRGRTSAEDAEARETLRRSDKQRAENVMIVDMVRNDLGRVALTGSVAVPELCAVERYPTVLQMTSSVTARSRRSLAELFGAIHPCASVTGAPKVRTMALIHELESTPRGVYTGAVGYLAPGGDARFAVGIRTATIDHTAGRVSFGVGSGIVWDSVPEDEYEECLLKARVLAPAGPSFDLLETMRWSPIGRFLLLDRHLERMSSSAEYFEYPFDQAAAVAALDEALAGCDDVRRVRLLLNAHGTLRVEHSPLVATVGDVRLALASEAIETCDPFLFHKTTRRDLYARARATVGRDCDDVVLWNRDGDVTESTVCNIVLDTPHGRVTPPVSAGLLPGTFRAELLADGTVSEAPVSVRQLCETGWCWLVNSVHGWRRGVLVR